MTPVLQGEVAWQSGELWVLFVEYSLSLLETLCPHSALHQPCFTSKHLSARGCSCHIPKQPKPWFGSSSEGAGSPALPGRAGSSSLLSMQMLPAGGGGGGSEPARHCLGTSCQCLPRGRGSRLRCPSAASPDFWLVGGLIANQPASTMSSTGAVHRALNASPAAIKSRILLPLQDPSSDSPSSAQGPLLVRKVLCPPASTSHPLPYNIKSTTDVAAC